VGNRQPHILPFPVKGLHEAAAFRNQPEATTSDALNVRPFDAIEGRLRGGQRNGVSKYIADPINGANEIQSISQLTTAFDPSTVVPGEELYSTDFTQSDGLLDNTDWYRHHDTGWTLNSPTAAPTTPDSTTGPTVVSNELNVTTSNTMTFGWLKSVTNPGIAYILRASVRLPTMNSVGGGGAVGFVIRGTDPASGITQYLWAALVSSSGTRRARIRWGDDSNDYTVTAGDVVPDPAAYCDLELRVNGDQATLYINDGLVLTAANPLMYAANTRFGIMVGRIGTTTFSAYPRMTSFSAWTALQPASLRTTKLVTVSGGSLYSGGKDGVSIATGANASIFNASGPVRMQQAYGKMYLCDGVAAHYTVYDSLTNTASLWTPLEGTLPVGSVDATKACTMIALYRGRVVLSGLQEDPQNWFMSKTGAISGEDPVDNPLRWNYTPAISTPTMAIAGNNSDAGLMGDVVTCLAPYNDDLMFMGGDHTLWVMRGDPAAGGLIDNISYQTGVVGPEAWTRDPEGNFYFFGAGALWRIDLGSTSPRPLSKGILDRTFGAIDYATYRVRLLWDDVHKGVHMYFTPLNLPTTSPYHYYWDARTEGFWKDQYPAVVGPTACWLYDADLPSDRALLVGGFDSYIRQISATFTKDDDGTAIASHVRYAPILLGGDVANSRLSEIVPVLAEASDPVSIRVFAAPSAESVTEVTTPQVSRVLHAGRNPTLRQRVTGNALQIELRNAVSAWATATYYAAGEQVTNGGSLYTCLEPHTSGTFVTDQTAGKWTADGDATTRSWATESVTGIIDVSGKTRSQRL
jgi:hypothetical protein